MKDRSQQVGHRAGSNRKAAEKPVRVKEGSQRKRRGVDFSLPRGDRIDGDDKEFD